MHNIIALLFLGMSFMTFGFSISITKDWLKHGEYVYLFLAVGFWLVTLATLSLTYVCISIKH